MTSVVVRWAVVGAAAAALGALPVSLAPVAGAEPQCADPAMCQSEPANPEDCNGGPDDMVCTRAGGRGTAFLAQPRGHSRGAASRAAALGGFR